MAEDPQDNKVQISSIESDTVESEKRGHPARSPAFRRKVGYISDRHAYYSKYYQKNKEEIRKRRNLRYRSSAAVRKYHIQKSKEWYSRNRIKTGTSNRTILNTAEGKRFYTIRHAAGAAGFSVMYFRDLVNRGIIPEASHKTATGWRLYNEGQIKLLKKVMPFYSRYSTAEKTQAILFCFWEDAEAGLTLTLDECAVIAMEKMRKKVKNNKQTLLKA